MRAHLFIYDTHILYVVCVHKYVRIRVYLHALTNILFSAKLSSGPSELSSKLDPDFGASLFISVLSSFSKNFARSLQPAFHSG